MWKSRNVSGTASFIFASKLKTLRNEIKIWAKDMDSKADMLIKKNLEELDALDNLDMDGMLDDNGKERRGKLKTDLASNMSREAISWRQKARYKLLKEDEKNTKYFHFLANYKKKNNYIEEMCTNGERICGNGELRQKSREYYQNLYREDGGQRPCLDDLFFKQISDTSRASLEVPFTEEEVLIC